MDKMGNNNPCCCIPLKRGVIFIAILDIVIGVLGVGLGIFAIFATIFAPSSTSSSTESTLTTLEDDTIQQEGSRLKKHSQGFVGLLLGLFVIYCLFQVAFGGVLIWGILKDKMLLLKAWLGFRASGALFTLGTLIAFGVLGSEATIQPGIVDGLSLVFSLYCLYVVHVYAAGVKKGANHKNIKPFSSSSSSTTASSSSHPV